MVTEYVLEEEDALCDFDVSVLLPSGDREIVPGEIPLNLEAVILPVSELKLEEKTVEKVIVFD